MEKMSLYQNYKNLIQLLEMNMHQDRGITFFFNSEDHFMSYHNLYEEGKKLLWHLQNKGLKAGNELIFQLEDEKEFVLTFWACIMGGIIPVPITIGNREAHREKLLEIWKVLKNPYMVTNNVTFEKLEKYTFDKLRKEVLEEEILSKTLIVDGMMEGNQEGTLHSSNPDDIAFIQFSSGSTGTPKGVVLTHRNLLVNIADIITASGATQQDSTLSWMPLTHDMGLIGFHLCPLAIGINQYIMPTTTFITSPLKWMEKTSAYKASLLASPNFGYKHFLSFLRNKTFDHWDLSCVRLILNGAEPISAELSDLFYETMAKWKLRKEAAFPVYGLAEASLAVSFPKVGEPFRKIRLDRNKILVGEKVVEIKGEDQLDISFVDLGYPVENCAIRICNEKNLELQEGFIGHVYIKGDNVTTGYYNNQEATERAITQDGWLNTGDLGFMQEGRLVITGRAKDIIFVNGQNYYPHDLERVVGEIEGAELGRVVTCGCFNKELQKEEIVMFVLFKKKVADFIDLALCLKKQVNLTTGLDVAYVLPVKTIPKTTSGKIQRFKLVEDYEKGVFKKTITEMDQLIKEVMNQREIDVPTTQLEEQLANIWAEVLGIEKIGINDSFFELGGDSIKATYIASKVYKELGFEVPLKDIFETPTIKALAEIASTVEKGEYSSIPKVDMAEHYPLSFPQKRMYILNNMDESTTYNITQAIYIEGDFSKERLEETYQKLVERHETLRTTFEFVEGEVVQKVNPPRKIKVNYKECKEEEIKELLESLSRPFDLKMGPLFRVHLIKTDERKYYLLLEAHHIIFDGTSMGILLKELIELYKGKTLEKPSLQYKDYVYWQLAQTIKQEDQEIFWLEKFKGELPVLDLPADYARPVLQNFEGAEVIIEIDENITSKLYAFARREGVSLQMVLLAAYYVLLAKYSGQEDIVVGIPTAGRMHPDLESILGMFVNTLALRDYPKGELNFNEFLRQLKHGILNAYKNQDYPLENLLTKLGVKRDMSRNPLFDTMFVMQNMLIPTIDEEDFKMKPYHLEGKNAKFDLTLFCLEEEGKIKSTFEFSSKLFNRNTIEKMAHHYINIINSIIDFPRKKISDIEIMSVAEKDDLLEHCNDTKATYPKESTLSQLFELQVEKTPKKIAIVHENEKITYSELNRRANQLARHLIKKGVAADGTVAILVDRSIPLVTSIMAVLKAGGAYIPIDPEYPKERIEYILKDSGAKILLKGRKELPEIQFDGLIMDIEKEEQYTGNEENLEITYNANNLAYIIYTSGSTGKPKGVMVENRGVVNYISWAAKSYLKGEDLDFPLYTTISFDLTVTSIFTPLLTGNCIIVYGEDDKELLINKIVKDNRVGVVKLTPSHLKLIKDQDNSQSKIKRFIVGGEQLETSLAEEAYRSFNGNIEIYNEYGPTEASVGCMIHQYNPERDRHQVIPIGIPADNVQIFILDKYLKPVPIGVVGEIYIAGDGLARGYVNKQETTEEKFVTNPFKDNEKMYRTGDLAKRLFDGNIEYIGRIDHQIKIRGYRIEIEEIESQLLKHKEIHEAIVIPLEDEFGDKNLCGYIVGGREFTASELRDYLLKKLPSYMVPTYFLQLEKIPLNINGKVDRDALPGPKERLTGKNEYIAPKDERQALIADVFAQVLAVEKVGINDNYFVLGGDSIKALQIVSRLNQFGLELNVKDILTHQTISALCINVDMEPKVRKYQQGTMAGEISFFPIHSWFFNQNFANANYYNQSILLKLRKAINMRTLEEGINYLIKHHDGLRLNYSRERNSLFYNSEHLKHPFIIEQYDISNLEEQEKEDCLKEIGEQMKASFNLEKDLLIKAALIKNTPAEDYLMVTAHHIVVDGVSWRIILEDLYHIIGTLMKDQEPQLPHKTASLIDWREALDDYVAENLAEKGTTYWEELETETFKLPMDFTTEDWSTANSAIVTINLTKEETQQLIKEANRSYNTQGQELLLVALTRAMTNWTCGTSVTLELEDHGRRLEAVDVSRTIGWFTAMYPIKLNVSKEDIGGQIKEIKEQLRSLSEDMIEFGLLKYIKNTLKESNNSMSEVRFNYLGRFDSELENDLFQYTFADTGAETSPLNQLTTKLDINSMIVNGSMRVEITYNQNAHRRESIESFAISYVEEIRQVLEHTLGKDEVEFTPSDFDTLDIGQDDLDSLFS
ncbi:non-ribosomal peptide synthetase [Alkaliphilus transvaalensis]|uniref:non-ribosomal peptide synthetase n=1 Tax=Alkaliphilus transvaalensis TaxID=114628 RepID=UPI000685858B|nr:non-ribosomal peptide synthetase [Alkaliphilus transvaalensis]